MKVYEVCSIFHVVNTINNEYLMRVEQIHYYVGKNGKIDGVTYKIIWSGVPKMDCEPNWGKVYPSYENGGVMSNVSLHQRMNSEDRPISPLDVHIVTKNIFTNELFEV